MSAVLDFESLFGARRGFTLAQTLLSESPDDAGRRELAERERDSRMEAIVRDIELVRAHRGRLAELVLLRELHARLPERMAARCAEVYRADLLCLMSALGIDTRSSLGAPKPHFYDCGRRVLMRMHPALAELIRSESPERLDAERTWEMMAGAHRLACASFIAEHIRQRPLVHLADGLAESWPRFAQRYGRSFLEARYCDREAALALADAIYREALGTSGERLAGPRRRHRSHPNAHDAVLAAVSEDLAARPADAPTINER